MYDTSESYSDKGPYKSTCSTSPKCTHPLSKVFTHVSPSLHGQRLGIPCLQGSPFHLWTALTSQNQFFWEKKQCIIHPWALVLFPQDPKEQT